MKNKLKIMSIFCFVFACCFSILLTGCSKSEPKIQIESQFKTNYYVGESLDVLGGILKYTDENEKESFVEITPEMISSFTTHTPGEYSMIVTYNNCTILVPYTVEVQPDIQLNTIYRALAQTQVGYIHIAFSSPTIVHIDALEELNPYLTPMEFIAAGSDAAVVMTKNTQNSKTIYKGSRQVDFQENSTTTATVTIEVLNSETLSLEIEYQGYPEQTIFAELTKMIPEIPTDISLNKIYRSEPLEQADNYYQYIVLTSQSTLYVKSSPLAKLTMNEMLLQDSLTVTRGVSEGKICYSYSYTIDNKEVSLSISVLEENLVSLVAKNGSETISCDFIRMDEDNTPYIEIATMFKNEYSQGETIDLTDGTIAFHDTKTDGIMFAQNVEITSEMISNFSTQTLGKHEMTITYKGCTMQLEYVVIADIDTTGFYCNNLGIFGEGYYEYVKFNSKTEMLFWASNVTPENMDSNYYGEETYEIVRNIEDGKVVYSIVSDVDNNLKIIVEESGHIIVTASQDGQLVEISLYKYSSTNN